MYFQDGKKEPYAGDERRKSDRLKLPNDLQTLVDVLDKRMACHSSCVIPRAAQPHISHLFGAIEDIGQGKIPRGIDEARDQHKDVKEILNSWKDAKRNVIRTVIWVITAFVLGAVGLGIIQRVTGG
jgi:hypothetical protein